METYREFIDKYMIVKSDDTEYNPPSYDWVDNTGEIVRCIDCIHRRKADSACGVFGVLVSNPNFFCAAGERKPDQRF